MPGFIINSKQDGPSNTAKFHREHRWKVTVNSPAGGDPSGARLTTFYAQSVQLPELEFEEEKVLGGSVYYKVAKKALWGDVTLKIYDVYGLYNFYKKWQDLIWTPQDGLKPASLYKGTVVIEMTGADGEANQKYTLKGAYPKRVAHGTLSYTNSEIKLLTIVWSYDYAEVVLSDGGNAAAGDAPAAGGGARRRVVTGS